MEMMEEMGYCSGIETIPATWQAVKAGQAPYTFWTISRTTSRVLVDPDPT